MLSMTLREFFSYIGQRASAWCRLHQITPESVLMYLSGERKSIGIVISVKIYIASKGIVRLDSMLLPEVARAIEELMLFKGTCPPPCHIRSDAVCDAVKSDPKTLDPLCSINSRGKA